MYGISSNVKTYLDALFSKTALNILYILQEVCVRAILLMQLVTLLKKNSGPGAVWAFSW